MQVYNLIRCIEQAYRLKGIHQEDAATWGLGAPTVKDLFNVLELTLARTRSTGSSSLLTLNKRLYSLLASSTFSRERAISFSELRDGITCFTLGDFSSGEAQAIFVETFLRRLYSTMLSCELTGSVSMYVLVDEAHRVVVSKGTELSLVAKIACEARKYGIGLIISNQNARNLDREIIANCAASFIFYQKEPQEEEYVVSLLANGSGNSRRERLQEKLRELRQFEYLAVTSELRDPVQVEFRPVFIPQVTSVEKNEAVVKNEAVNEEVVLGKLETRVYRLGELTEAFGNRESIIRTVNRLVGGNLAEIMEIKTLEGTDETFIGKRKQGESLEHSAYVQMISDFLAGMKIPRVVMNCANEPDIVMEFEGSRIAVEVETGRKNDNRKILAMLDRRARDFDRVLVVLTDENQMERYMELLGSTDKTRIQILPAISFKKILG